MLISYNYSFCTSYILISFAIWAASLYFYLVNARRPNDDPKKKVLSRHAIFLAPVTWPLYLSGALFVRVLELFVVGILSLLRLVLWLLVETLRTFLSLMVASLRIVLSKLNGHYFLQVGLICFILGNIFQCIALFVKHPV